MNTTDSLHSKRPAFAALTLASIIWGINSPIMKIALTVTPVFVLAFLRFFLASFLLLFTKPEFSIEKKDIAKIVLASWLGVTLNIYLFFKGLTLTSAINAGVIISSVPLFTLLFSAIFLKEKVEKNMIYGSLLGFLGIVIILFQPIFSQGFSGNLAGNFLLLLAALTWVGYEIITKDLFKKYSPATVTFYSFVIGSVTFLPFAFSDIINVLPVILYDSRFVIGLFFGVVFASTLAYYFWQWGLSKIEATRVGFFLYLDPIVATIASVIILNESVSMTFIAGALCIFIGLYIAEKRVPVPGISHKKQFEKKMNKEFSSQIATESVQRS